MVPVGALVTVVILVAGEEGTHPEAQLGEVVRDVLDPGLVLQMRRGVETPDPDPSTIAWVTVTWNDRAHTAVVSVVRVAEKRSVERRIVFDPSDDEAERTRTVGLSIASMLPAELRASAKATPKEVTAFVAPSPAPGPITLRETPPEVARPGLRERASLEFRGLGAGGGAAGWGGLVGIQVPATPVLGLRVDVGLRQGSIPSAGATLWAAHAMVGGVLQSDHRWLRPALQAGVGIGRFEIVRNAETQAHYQPVVRLGVDLALHLVGPAWAVAGVAGEWTAPQPVFVQQKQQGELESLTGLGTVGIRLAL